MKKISFISLAFLIVFGSSFVLLKPKKYKGKVISVFNTYEGDIMIDLNGPNKEMIEIKNVKIVKNGLLNFSSESKSNSVNSLLVRQILIDSITYYLFHLENDLDKTIQNACVTLESGRDSLGLFKFFCEDV